MEIITGTDGNHKNSFGHSKAPLPFWQGRFMRLREPYSMGFQLCPEGNPPRRLHLVKLNDMGLLFQVHIQHRPGAKEKMPDSLPRPIHRGGGLLIQQTGAVQVFLGLPDEPLPGLPGKNQVLPPNLQEKPGGIPGGPVKIPAVGLGEKQPLLARVRATKASRRSSSIAARVRTLREGKIPSFMPHKNTLGNSRPLAAWTVMSFT